MAPINLAALGTPRDPWESEMLAVARRELEKAVKYEEQACAAAGAHTAVIAMADNALGYAEALLYAVRRRREVCPE
jgi:hypothetical protein